MISLDGTTGEVILGEVDARRASEPPAEFDDDPRVGRRRSARASSRVRANADNGPDAANARQFGAEGIGLCRTEHMFLGEDRLPVVRRMILADTTEPRRPTRSRSCASCRRPTSRRSSRRWTACPVTVRLLDPPLHEFLPDVDELAIKEATVGPRRRGAGAARRRASVARVQPDARHPRRAPRRREAGSLRDAGAGARWRPPPSASPQGGKPVVEIMIPLTVTREELGLGPRVGRGRDRRGDARARRRSSTSPSAR